MAFMRRNFPIFFKIYPANGSPGYLFEVFDSRAPILIEDVKDKFNIKSNIKILWKDENILVDNDFLGYASQLGGDPLELIVLEGDANNYDSLNYNSENRKTLGTRSENRNTVKSLDQIRQIVNKLISTENSRHQLDYVPEDLPSLYDD